MDTRKYEILMTAVHEGSFSRAAETCGYTQSGITHMISGLEKETGLTLLKRSHKGVEFTKEGEQLYPYISEMLSACGKLENRISEIRSQKEETIRIAAYASIAMQWLPEILYRFRRECPKVNVDLRMVDHALEPFELLQEGRADVIFAGSCANTPCEWIHLYDEPLLAVLPRSMRQESRDFPLRGFSGLDFLMPYGKFDMDVLPLLQKEGVKAEITEAHVDDETVIRMVGRGLGVTIMGELMIRGRTDDVLCLPLQPQAYRKLGMGIRREKQHLEEVKKLKSCVLRFVEELHTET